MNTYDAAIPEKSKIKAVIFDLDGTLVDSEPNYFAADKRLLSEYGVFDINEEDKKKYIGIGSKVMLTDMRNKYQIEDSVDILLSKKDKYYFELAKKNTAVFPEMKVFLEILKENGYPLAIASGSSKEIINEILSITHLTGFFDVIVSAEEVALGKPNPDVFLEAAKRLNIPAVNCLVLEDSMPGVEAAKRALMYCAAIPYSIEEPISESFLKSDMLITDGMCNFSAKKIYEWLISI